MPDGLAAATGPCLLEEFLTARRQQCRTNSNSKAVCLIFGRFPHRCESIPAMSDNSPVRVTHLSSNFFPFCVFAELSEGEKQVFRAIFRITPEKQSSDAVLESRCRSWFASANAIPLWRLRRWDRRKRIGSIAGLNRRHLSPSPSFVRNRDGLLLFGSWHRAEL